VAKHGVTDFLRVFEDVGTTFFDLERDLLVTLDEVGNINRVNPAFEIALGQDEASVLGHELIRYVEPNDLAKFIRSFDTMQKPERVRLLKRECGEVIVRLIAYKFRRSDEGLRGYLVLRIADDVNTSQATLQ
jgi:PAS domain S-box-containing protein